jgi:signal transduction histidine kinase
MANTRTAHRWPLHGPPNGLERWSWQPRRLSDLPAVRRDLRAALARDRPDRDTEHAEELHEQLVLLFDELLSNALRHGGMPASGAVSRTADGWLLIVSDTAAGTPPHPDLDRDPAQGGLGLRMVADLSAGFGWCADGHAKHVWAALNDS